METRDPRLVKPIWNRAEPLIVWSVWLALTVVAILFIRQYARNMPFGDDFELVPVVTGREPVSLHWAWALHNEHRPLVPRLILAGLSRYVNNDFRTPKYLNAGLLSLSAASMLLLARKLRGSTKLADAVLALSMLNIGQAESLMTSLAMNLILTTWISCELIAVAGMARRRGGGWTALWFGLSLILLPLCGGSGVAMLPPLVAWLAGYVAWGWWSGREPGGMARAIGVLSLMACSAIVALYFSGFARPAYHPAPPSIAAVASTTLECLSLALIPSPGTYWSASGPIIAILIAGTFWLLLAAGLRSPDERLRASGLAAVILSTLSMAAAIGLSRSGLGPSAGIASRYVTITAPLLGALYIAWLLYGPSRVRWFIRAGLFALLCMTLPASTRFALKYGRNVRSAELRVERAAKAQAPASRPMDRVCPPIIYPDPKVAYEFLEMLKAARMGPFGDLDDDREAAAPGAPSVVR